MAYASKDKERVAHRAYYEKNKEKIRARAGRSYRAYYEKNRERILARNKAWRDTNKEKMTNLQLEWAKANPGKVKISKRRHRGREALTRISSTFGLSADEYQKMLGEQNGLCAICFRTNDGRRLCVDHAHVNGFSELSQTERRKFVRGLLCHNCNIAIGYFRDDPRLLARGVEYLRRFQ